MLYYKFIYVTKRVLANFMVLCHDDWANILNTLLTTIFLIELFGYCLFNPIRTYCNVNILLSKLRRRNGVCTSSFHSANH